MTETPQYPQPLDPRTGAVLRPGNQVPGAAPPMGAPPQPGHDAGYRYAPRPYAQNPAPAPPPARPGAAPPYGPAHAQHAYPGGGEERTAALPLEPLHGPWPDGDGQPPGRPPTGPAAAARPPGSGGYRPRRVPRTALGLVAMALVAAGAGGAAGYFAGHNPPAATAAAVSSPTAPAENAAATSGTSVDVQALASSTLPSVVMITERTSSLEGIGSGIVLTSDGDILTNNHVITDANSDGGTITVTFNNGKTANATVLGTDSSGDLAVIKAQGVSGLTPASLGDSSTVKAGQQVVAIGAPEGLQGTVTEGIVSATDRSVSVQEGDSSPQGGYGAFPWSRDYDNGGGWPGGSSGSSTVTIKDAIQTDAAINPGNSGGPLFNGQGQVIGINFAIYSSSSSSDGSGGGNQGIGFTIPINDAKSVITQLENGSST